MNSEYAAAAILEARPSEWFSIGNVANAIGRGPTTASIVLRSLHEKGWVERRNGHRGRVSYRWVNQRTGGSGLPVFDQLVRDFLR